MNIKGSKKIKYDIVYIVYLPSLFEQRPVIDNVFLNEDEAISYIEYQNMAYDSNAWLIEHKMPQIKF